MELRPSVVLIQTIAPVAVLAVIGTLSVWAGIAWLVASLGPSAMIQTLTSERKTASMYNTCVGQLIGEAAGFIGVFLVSAQMAPPLVSGSLPTWDRVAAVTIAFTIMIPVQILLKAKHPPAGAVALLLALGVEKPIWHTAWVLAAGIALVTIVGEVARFATVGMIHGISAARRTISMKP